MNTIITLFVGFCIVGIAAIAGYIAGKQEPILFNHYKLTLESYGPVQIQGKTIDDKFFYFRASRGHIEFHVANHKDEVYYHHADNYNRDLEYSRKLVDFPEHGNAILLCTFWLNEYYSLSNPQ